MKEDTTAEEVYGFEGEGMMAGCGHGGRHGRRGRKHSCYRLADQMQKWYSEMMAHRYKCTLLMNLHQMTDPS